MRWNFYIWNSDFFVFKYVWSLKFLVSQYIVIFEYFNLWIYVIFKGLVFEYICVIFKHFGL